MPDRVGAADQELTADSHAASVADVLARLGATEAGLSSAQAAARAARYGPNALPPAAHRPAVLRFLGELNNTLIYVLLAAAAASAVLGDWIDVGVVVAVEEGDARAIGPAQHLGEGGAAGLRHVQGEDEGGAAGHGAAL
jgi:magnesium-transporting ATPase (P-type)